MINDLRVTVLVENTVRQPKLLAEHGLSLWIEADGHRLLLDTGQGNVLRHNAAELGIRLRDARMLVLSHGHYDHSGGLPSLLEVVGQVDVYLHPAAAKDKFHCRKEQGSRAIGAPTFDEEAIQGRHRRVVWTRQPTRLADGVFVTGPIPRRNDFEDTGGDFYLDEDCSVPDPMVDDQAIYIETPRGTVVLIGCAHAGVVNTLDYVAELTDGRPIYAVLGGMHLLHADSHRLEATLDALRRFGIEKVGTAHCTGIQATVALWSRLPGVCFECCVGSVFQV